MKRSGFSTLSAVLLLLAGLVNTVSGAGLVWGRTALAIDKMADGVQSSGRIGRSHRMQEKMETFKAAAPVMGVVLMVAGLCALAAGAAMFASAKAWPAVLAASSMALIVVVTGLYSLIVHFGSFTLFVMLLHAFIGVMALYSRRAGNG